MAIQEKESNLGPYRGALSDYTEIDHRANKQHPNWYGDFGNCFYKAADCYSGVQSIKLLKHWFPVKLLCNLGEFNYLLQVYEEEPIAMSDLQIVFHRENLIKEYQLPPNKSSMYRLLNKLERKKSWPME